MTLLNRENGKSGVTDVLTPCYHSSVWVNGTRGTSAIGLSCFLVLALIGSEQSRKQVPVTSQVPGEKVVGDSPVLHLSFLVSKTFLEACTKIGMVVIGSVVFCLRGPFVERYITGAKPHASEHSVESSRRFYFVNVWCPCWTERLASTPKCGSICIVSQPSALFDFQCG